MDLSLQRSTTRVHFRPTVFNVFINDMYLFINKCTLYNYTDDNSLSCAATEVEQIMSSLQMDGNKVIQWFTDNGMQANPSKFQFMVISPDDDCAQSLVLNENTILVSEKHVQVLGVIIDSKLNFPYMLAPCVKRPPANQMHWPEYQII